MDTAINSKGKIESGTYIGTDSMLKNESSTTWVHSSWAQKTTSLSSISAVIVFPFRNNSSTLGDLMGVFDYGYNNPASYAYGGIVAGSGSNSSGHTLRTSGSSFYVRNAQYGSDSGGSQCQHYLNLNTYKYLWIAFGT